MLLGLPFFGDGQLFFIASSLRRIPFVGISMGNTVLVQTLLTLCGNV
jgi:hypothetical protein